MGTLRVYIFSYGRGKFLLLLGMGQCSVTNVTYRTHVALRCRCSLFAAVWLDSSAIGIAWLNIYVWHSDFLEVGTKIDVHSNGLLGEGKIKRFYLDVGNFHVSIVPLGNLGVNISS